MLPVVDESGFDMDTVSDDAIANASDLFIENATSAWSIAATTVTTRTSNNLITQVQRRRMADAYFYSLGVIIPLGLLCNLFCILIFTLSAGLRRTTTGHYLTALACADVLFLVGDLIRWLNTPNHLGAFLPGMGFTHSSTAACQAGYCLRYGAKFVSAWITVAIVIERLVTIAMPLKVREIRLISFW